MKETEGWRLLGGRLPLQGVVLSACGCLLFLTPGYGEEPDPRRSQYVELSEAERWTLASQGDYHCRYESRDLYCMYHLCRTAAAGDQAALTTTVTLPADWEPPFGLELFCSDDYQVRTDQMPTEGWMSCHAYPGHRFKQILVDEEVVWEQDVADPGNGGPLGVDLTGHVEAGKPFQLTLRVLDRVGTDVKLEGEHFWAGSFDPKEDPRAFSTHVYWGDLLLTERFDPNKLHPLRETPSLRRFRERAARGQVPRGPVSDAQPPAELALEAPAGAPPGWPLSCGVPLPRGAVREVSPLRLEDAAGRSLGAQFQALSWWQDGSVRWALASFPLPAGAQNGDRVILTWPGSEGASLEAPVQVQNGPEGCLIRNSLITLRLPGKGPVAIAEVLGSQGQRLAGELQASLEVEGEDGTRVAYQAVWNDLEVLAEGPCLATVQLNGELTGPAGRLGRGTLRLSLGASSPWVRAWFRLFNDTEQHLKVTRMALAQQVSPGPTRGVAATLEEPAGWFAVDGPAGTVFSAVRWAAEMPTKRLELQGDQLLLQLFVGTPEIPYFRPRPGEARRTEVLLGYYGQRPGEAALQAVAQAVQRPPRLWDSRWTCATGALGYGYVHDEQEFPRLTANRRKAYGDLDRKAVGQIHFDMRHFGDRRYGDKQWCNNYYDALRGFLAEYLMTGNPNAFDRAAEAMLHTIDVDQCHWWPDPSFVGGTWSYTGDDHSNAGYCWAAQQRTAAGLSYYYRLTGDPDVREALRGMGEFALSHNTGYGSVRDHGGILTAQVWAYDELGEERYLQGALQTMSDLEKRMSLRRGPYLEYHGNYSYLVSVPWMASELADALYHLWQLSGNPDAAANALRIAESFIQENGVWGGPGEIGGYSGNPYFKMNSGYHIIIAPVLGYAYEMTANPDFLLWARACFERTLEEDSVDSLTNNYWLAPSLLYLLHRYAEVETLRPPPPAVRVPPNWE